MKPFSLTAVLQYRRQLEDSAATRLVHAQLELQAKQQEYDELVDRYTKLLARLDQLQDGGITVEDLLQYENHLSWLKGQQKKVADELHSATVKVSQKRRLVVDRRRDKKILEKLKDKQNREWRQYLEKKEAAQLDEIAVLAHDRDQQKT
ncbi:flagellar export protein FliJ [Desulfopila inferna]|uniref:flagellar export protein FliJ n=1 Tax=Desulfopila inferna TaxID=468528 RepID=UPI001965DE20|nr:flagellar export protein FliJ [Desulfopila inferna]MBM9602973.1 flagellar export protein FliJ [Desulfopila inferna]